MKSLNQRQVLGLIVAALAVASGPVIVNQVEAALPTVAEQAQARSWASARLEGKVLEQSSDVGLMVYANNDPVQKRLRNGKSMNIKGKLYNRGLYCHAVSDVLVKLPGKAKTFMAEIGVDSNENTAGGRGSVEFIVSEGERELYRSAVTREGAQALPIKIDLKGAKEFSLKLTDGGDEIACDQADWANARVLMEDGSVLWLDELPFLGEASVKPSTDPFFSFTYDGKSSSELLKNWNFQRSQKKMGESKVSHELTWSDSSTGLEIRCAAVEYLDFPTVEWTLYFKNTGKEKTPILENIQALDALFPAGGTQAPVLHHQTGAPSRQDDYKPMLATLNPNKTKRFVAEGGKGTDEQYPYYNLEFPGNGGVIMVVGWPGQWAADFTSMSLPEGGKNVQIRAGQELTHLFLNPGEEIRTPLMVVQFWEKGYEHSQNVWRSWMLAHNMPQVDGKAAPLHWAACSSHQYHEMINANSESQMNCIDRYLAERIGLNYWWMDAGWYVNNGDWPNTGTWEVDQKRFPGGFKPISDHAHAKGVKTLVWFEPERVTPETWLYDEHPEWLLRNTDKEGDQRLFNHGNPEAWKWLVEHIDGMITREGIDLYRQDYNIAPLSFWRMNDAADRQGITENHYISGYLAYWDQLRTRHPGMLIDSCASGGRRNDLETMRRAVPLLRSDFIFDPIGQQGHTYGMALWIPLFGTGQMDDGQYGFRSCMTPFINSCWDIRPPEANYDAKRDCYKTWSTVKDFYYGDYYPLTPYSLDPTLWLAWQFDRPDLESGMVQVFRRPQSPYESIRLQLKGLDPEATYQVWNMDGGTPFTERGSKLMEEGTSVTSQTLGGEAMILLYQKTQDSAQ